MLPFNSSHIIVGGMKLSIQPNVSTCGPGYTLLGLESSSIFIGRMYVSFYNAIFGSCDMLKKAAQNDLLIRNRRLLIVISKPGLSKDSLYQASEAFLNRIRTDYYKYIKLPQAFKEVRVFTIKVNYSSEPVSKINPEWEKWNKDRGIDVKTDNKDKETTDKNAQNDGQSGNKNNSNSNSSNNNNSSNGHNDRDNNSNDKDVKKDDKKDDKHKSRGKYSDNKGYVGYNYGGYGSDEECGYKRRNNYDYFPFKSVPPKEITVIKWIPELIVKQVGQTYKPIEYLYMSNKDKRYLQAILSNFTTNSELYQKLGIQHKMSLLVHGKPGTGKTTAIRSIASFLQRDIYYLDLKGIRNNSHLQMIFELLQSNCRGGGVVVMEDIDCMTDIVLNRSMS